MRIVIDERSQLRIVNYFRKGRCVLVILASQWDPVAVPALSVQRALFLVLEILIQDPRNQVLYLLVLYRYI